MIGAVIRLACTGAIGDGLTVACDVALIGFGEAAATFARAGRWADRASGYDIQPERRAAAASSGVASADNVADTLRSAPLILSLVTADQSLTAAQSYACCVAPHSIWCDGNSVAPDTKRTSAKAIEAAGGRYVDMAILAPVEPKELAVPVLLSGEAADDAAGRLGALGFTHVRVVGNEIGQASAIKMIRSVMVKGIEALTAEMMLAARAAGVIDLVLGSLDESDIVQPWARRSAYNLERMMAHGERRAAEMEESARTLESLGVEPIMTTGTIRRQREMAQAAHRSHAA